MNWTDYELALRIAAQRGQLSDVTLESLINYGDRISRQGLPVIIDPEHCCLLMGIEHRALARSLNDKRTLYFSFKIPKISGGFRPIDQPTKTLATLQKWILRNILDHIPPHEAATAFRRGKSILNNAAPHAHKKKVFALDIQDFFGTIDSNHVLKLFQNIGYESGVCDLLTNLICFNERLPQGACTSPSVSNLVMRNVDEQLTQWSHAHNVNYTRYADDLTFSGNFRPGDVLSLVSQALGAIGLRLNSNKTRLMLRHQRQEVTGLTVNEGVRVSRALRMQLRQEAYYISKYSMNDHEIRRGALRQNRRAHLQGLAEFVRFADGQNKDAVLLARLVGKPRPQN